MPATISATGTFTDLSTVLDATRSKAIGNEPRLEGALGTAPGGLGINLEVLKTAEGLEFNELVQFIDLLAVQYGLLHWQAAHLLHILLGAHMRTKSDTVLGDSRGSRLYVP